MSRLSLLLFGSEAKSETLSGTVDRITEEIVNGVVNALPRIIVGIAFVIVAYVGIKLILWLIRPFLDRAYPGDQELVSNLILTVVGIFLWFTVVLILLKILKMDDIAAGIGTATGFIALGVSYALSDMIADTVSGVYLLRDPNFNPGDKVTVASSSTTGRVKSIELRKSRFELENGDTVVIANSDVEKRWTQIEEGAD